jgi:transcriptional regulator NrdR family protein
MKCPLCGAPTDVKQTRIQKDNSVTRYRLCFNNHSFRSTEKNVTLPKLKKPKFKE